MAKGNDSINLVIKELEAQEKELQAQLDKISQAKALLVGDSAPSSGRGRPAGRKKPGRPASKKRPGRPAAKKGPGRPAAKKSPGRPAAKKSPGRPAAKKGPGRPAAKKGPGRPAAKKGPGRPAAKKAGRPAAKKAGRPAGKGRATYLDKIKAALIANGKPMSPNEIIDKLFADDPSKDLKAFGKNIYPVFSRSYKNKSLKKKAGKIQVPK